MNQVQSWVGQHAVTLETCTEQAVQERNFRDDRLAIVLDALSDEQKWQPFETSLNRQFIRVYHLQPKRVRIDSTTASGYWTVSEQGLFQYGHSKDHRRDLPQLKVMLSALDPLGLPVATQVVSGERADDGLYLPAIEEVSQSLDEHGLLYVGDCKMAALATRASIQAKGDYYLCPLADKQVKWTPVSRFCWRMQKPHQQEMSYEAGARAAKREWRVCPRGRFCSQANRRTTLTAAPIMKCCNRVLASPT